MSVLISVGTSYVERIGENSPFGKLNFLCLRRCCFVSINDYSLNNTNNEEFA